MNDQTLYIYTIGCQMNVYDSDQIENILKPSGYRRTQQLESADLIIVNTCSIRAKAEQKAFSFLGRLSEMKRRTPRLIIAMGGCVAQQEGEKALKRMPHIDLIFGTHAITRLPQMIAKVKKDRCRLVDVGLSEAKSATDVAYMEVPDGQISSFVTIMRGCDNYCTYCVVPYVRGRENSRPPKDILTEIKHLVSKGIKEVTLLGQNVNSYGQKEGMISFSQLLALINDIDGLKRIRFTTSHPKDLSPDLMAAFGKLDKLCSHIHLPIQSGSDSILKRMNRKYTRLSYLDKVAQVRRFCPEIAITSDIIVGFPGESDADFQQTLDMIREVGYHSLFAFKYSDRPNVPSVRFSGKVSEEIKNDRLQAVLNLQEQITKEKYRNLIGSVQSVLVEGQSKRSEGREESQERHSHSTVQWSGRTSTNLIVNFFIPPDPAAKQMGLTGCMVDVKIESAMAHSVSGRIHVNDPAKDGLKGDNWYAA